MLQHSGTGRIVLGRQSADTRCATWHRGYASEYITHRQKSYLISFLDVILMSCERFACSPAREWLARDVGERLSVFLLAQ